MKAGPATGRVIVIGAGLSLAGCAATNEAPVLNFPSMPSVGSIPALGSGAHDRPLGSATDLYARIGRGAVACWFGAKGPLKLSYIYHADAEPASRGGKAEIIIHQREPGQPNPRGAKAYRIAIVPGGETAAVVSENLKMPEGMAKGMTRDVERWSHGENDCASADAVAAWSPKEPEPPAAPNPKAGKTAKAKPKTVAAKVVKP